MAADEAESDLQAQIDALVRRVSAGEFDVAHLGKRADAAETRADAMEARSLIDQDMIADLRHDGVLSRQHVEELEEALQTSRTIGTAIGIIMASRHLDQDAAFIVLRTASQNSNRSVSELATQLILTGGTI